MIRAGGGGGFSRTRKRLTPEEKEEERDGERVWVWERERELHKWIVSCDGDFFVFSFNYLMKGWLIFLYFFWRLCWKKVG